MRAQLAVRVASENGIEGDHVRWHKVSGGLDQMPGGSFYAADCLFDGGKCAEPVRCVGQFRSGDTGKEVFRSAGKTSDLVRYRRTEDQDSVVRAGSEQTVDGQLNWSVEQSGGGSSPY